MLLGDINVHKVVKQIDDICRGDDSVVGEERTVAHNQRRRYVIRAVHQNPINITQIGMRIASPHRGVSAQVAISGSTIVYLLSRGLVDTAQCRTNAHAGIFNLESSRRREAGARLRNLGHDVSWQGEKLVL